MLVIVSWKPFLVMNYVLEDADKTEHGGTAKLIAEYNVTHPNDICCYADEVGYMIRLFY